MIVQATKFEKDGKRYIYSFKVFSGYTVNLNNIIYSSKHHAYRQDMERELFDNKYNRAAMITYITIPLKGPPVIQASSSGW